MILTPLLLGDRLVIGKGIPFTVRIIGHAISVRGLVRQLVIRNLI